jgi:DamX protein
LSLAQNIAACHPSEPLNVVILIDNGQHADVEIYRDLIELIKTPGYQFSVIFAAVRDSAQISQLNSLHPLVEFHLEPLDISESQMLLSFYYASMIDSEKAEVSRFITQSKGIPAKLLLWQEQQGGDKRKKPSKSKKKQKAKTAKVEVKGAENSSKRNIVIAVAAVVMVAVVAAATWFFIPQSQEALKAQLRAKVEDGQSADTKPEAEESSPNSETGQSAIVEAEQADDQKPNLDELLVQKWDDDRPIKDELKFDKPIAEPETAEPETAEPETVEPETVEPERADPETTEPEATQTQSTQADERMDNQWFLAQDDKQSMVQLAGVSNKQVLSTYLLEHQLQDKARIYQSNRDGKPWYVVTLGPYTDHNAARNAIGLLSAPLQATQPWAKSIKAIQSEITNAN